MAFRSVFVVKVVATGIDLIRELACSLSGAFVVVLVYLSFY